MVALGQSRVGDDEPAAVEDVVRLQGVAELQHAGAERRGLARQLVQRLAQAVRDLDVAALQRAHQLLLVVAAHRQRGARLHHAHGQPQHARRVRPAVDEVAQEHDRAALRVPAVGRVAQLAQQVVEFDPAAVDVADHVERAGQVAQVVRLPRRFVDHGDSLAERSGRRGGITVGP